MISAETIKGVQELLKDRGVEQREGEALPDYVARGLGLSSAQTETLLSGLHDGLEVDEAARRAGVDAGALPEGLLTQLARAIGATLGRATG